MSVVTIGPNDGIMNALPSLRPGDILELADGVYTGPANVIHSPFANQVVIQAAAGAVPKIENTDPAVRLVDLQQMDSVRISHIVFEQIGQVVMQNLVYIYQSSNIEISDCDLSGPSSIMMGWDGPNGRILRNRIHDSVMDIGGDPRHGYGLYSSANNLLIDGNEYFNLGSFALHNWFFTGQTEPWTIRNNYFHNNGLNRNGTGGQDLQISGFTYAYSNLFAHNLSGAAQYNGGATGSFHDNILYDDGWGSAPFYGQPCAVYSSGSMDIYANNLYTCPGICDASGNNNVHDNTWHDGAPTPLPPNGLIVVPPVIVPPPAPPPTPTPTPAPTPTPTVGISGTGVALLLLGAMLFLPKIRRTDI